MTTQIPTTSELPYMPNQAAMMNAALTLENYELRYNTRAERLEYRYLDKPWQPLEDRDVAHIRNSVFSAYHTKIDGKVKPYKVSKDNFYDYADAITYDVEVDPFRQYLDSLPDIDPTDDPTCDRIFHDLFQQKIQGDEDQGLTDADEEAFHRYASRLIPLAAVHRAYNPGCKYDLAVTISGPQEAGKDTLFEQLLPQIPNQEFYTSSFSFDMDSQKMNEATAGAVFVCASEMAGITRSDKIEHIKRWMTEKSDKGRRAYRRNSETRPRDFCVVCTTNFEQPLPNDPTGNRRFMVVELTADRAVTALEDWFAELITDSRFEEPTSRRDIMWAEAKALFKQTTTDRVILPDDIRRIQKIKNTDYSHSDLQLEEMWEVAIRNGFDVNHPHTSSAIAVALGFVNRPDEYPKQARSFQYRIEDLMKNHGFVLTKKRTIRFMKDDDPVLQRLFEKRLKVWVPKGHALESGTSTKLYSQAKVMGDAYVKFQPETDQGDQS